MANMKLRWEEDHQPIAAPIEPRPRKKFYRAKKLTKAERKELERGGKLVNRVAVYKRSGAAAIRPDG